VQCLEHYTRFQCIVWNIIKDICTHQRKLKLIHETKPTKFTNLYKCYTNVYILSIWLFYTMTVVYKMINLALCHIILV
jgi:hypothetical protein